MTIIFQDTFLHFNYEISNNLIAQQMFSISKNTNSTKYKKNGNSRILKFQMVLSLFLLQRFTPQS